MGPDHKGQGLKTGGIVFLDKERYMFPAKHLSVAVFVCLLSIAPALADEVPGVIMAYSPPSSGIYIGSPGIAVLPDGTYVAKYDDCGAASTEWARRSRGS